MCIIFDRAVVGLLMFACRFMSHFFFICMTCTGHLFYYFIFLGNCSLVVLHNYYSRYAGQKLGSEINKIIKLSVSLFLPQLLVYFINNVVVHVFYYGLLEILYSFMQPIPIIIQQVMHHGHHAKKLINTFVVTTG